MKKQLLIYIIKFQNMENELNKTKKENFNKIEILKKEKSNLSLEKKNIE